MKKIIISAFSLVLALGAILPGAASAANLDPLNNGSFEQQGTAATNAYDWQVFGQGYTRVNTAHTGTWSARVTLPSRSTQLAGAYQRVDFQQTTLKPVFVGAWVKGAAITNNGGYFGASMYVEIHLTNGQVVYWNSIPNYGTFDWRYIGFNTSNLFVQITQPIDYIFIVPMLGKASGTAYFDDIVVKEYEPTGGAVTIIYDDGELNTYTQAKPLMDARGFKGVSAAISGNLTDSDYMNATQLKALQTSGWEIMSHSVNHNDMTTQTTAAAKIELTNSKNTLTNAGLTVKNFAFPYGAYNGFLLGEGMKTYRSMRAFEQGDNPQGLYLSDVKIRGVKSTTTQAEFQGWLDNAKNNKRWLVLVYHTIANTGDDEYHTPPAALTQMLDAVVASGLPVVTYDKGLDMFAAPIPPLP